MRTFRENGPVRVAWRVGSLGRVLASALFLLVCASAAKGEEQPAAPPASPPSESAPPVFLGFEKDPFNSNNPNPAAAEPGVPAEAPRELTLTLQPEPDGPYVAFNDFLLVLRSIDAGARGEWDGLLGVFRITAAGRSLQALANQPVLVIDGRYRPVSKPLRVRSGAVLVPIESVKLLLKALNYEFEVEPEAKGAAGPPASPGGGAATAGTPTPASVVKPKLSSPRPRAAGSGDAERMAPREGSFLASSGPLLSPVMDQSLPPLEAPQIGATAIGLTWGQLADSAHNLMPRRLTLVRDPSLADLAERVQQLLARALGLEVTIVNLQGRRDNPDLFSEISRSRPELLLDLMVGAASASEGTPENEGEERDFELWAVHDALWPADARLAQPAARSLPQLYKAHQFQNLALGSMLRGELMRGFPDRNVRYALTPAYLLRRVDAPSAAILIPASIPRDEASEVDRTARAIAGGVVAYCRGMESATRR